MIARKLSELSALGLSVTSNTAPPLSEYLSHFEDRNLNIIPETEIISRFGWVASGGKYYFLLGNACISDNGIKSGRGGAISFHSTSSTLKNAADGYSAEGTFDDWLKMADQLQAYPIAMALFYAAFTAPVLKILNHSSFVTDLYGTTSTGKTSVMHLIASIWGHPRKIRTTWNNTIVYFERMAAIATDLPFFVDDSKQAKNDEVVGSIIYQIANEIGRGRANTTDVNSTHTWKTVAISTGEVKATEFTQDAGTRTRCLEITDLPFGKTDSETAKFVDQLKSAAQGNFGWAGQRFVEFLCKVQDRWDIVRERFQAYKEHFKEGMGSGAEGRLLDNVAAIAVTAELVKIALNVVWKIEEPLKILLGATRAAKSAPDAVRALRKLNSWMVENPAKFRDRVGSTDIAGSSPHEPLGGWAGKWSSGDDWKEVAFFPNRFSQLMEEFQFKPHSVLSEFKERNWINTDGPNSLTVKRSAGGVQTRMHVIPRSAFDELESLEAEIQEELPPSVLPGCMSFSMSVPEWTEEIIAKGLLATDARHQAELLSTVSPEDAELWTNAA